MPIDEEVILRYRIEPRDEFENLVDSVDNSDFAIYRTKIELICQEGKDVLMRCGISDAIQAGDCIAGVYTASGDLSLASVGTYLHVATGQIPIKYILKYYVDDPTVGVNDGDIFFCNEAIYGGIHNPDQLNVLPVFVEDQIVAWVVAASHEPETGAIIPGGMPPNAPDRYSEGIKIPPLKVARNFQMMTDVLNSIVNQVRDERMIATDMHSRAGACVKMRERLLELISVIGVDLFRAVLRKACEVAAAGATAKISELNDGVYRHVVFFDTIGYEEGLAKVSVELRKQGGRITLNLDGSSPQTRSYLNARPHILRALLVGDLAQYLFSDLPASSGLLQPFEILAPKGTCVNPSFDAALSGSVRLSPMVTQGVHMCINKLIFDSRFREYVSIPLGTGSRNITHGGFNQFGQRVYGMLTAAMNGGGGGARPEMDGVDGAGVYFGGLGDSLDIEHEELRTPFIYLFRQIPCDAGGFGRQRGGAGIANCILLRGNIGPYSVSSVGVTTRFPVDQGIFGGYAAALAPIVEVKDAGWMKSVLADTGVWPSTYHELLEDVQTRHRIDDSASNEYSVNGTISGTREEGSVVALIASSAGGYGDVLDRDPEAVVRDLRRGFTSAWAAHNVYHVRFHDDGSLNDVATAEARDQEHASRIRRGMKYDEFESQWSRKKPSDEILRFYGPWPAGMTFTDEESIPV